MNFKEARLLCTGPREALTRDVQVPEGDANKMRGVTDHCCPDERLRTITPSQCHHTATDEYREARAPGFRSRASRASTGSAARHGPIFRACDTIASDSGNHRTDRVRR